MANLDHARKYLEPWGFEGSLFAGVAWYGWPAAIVVKLIGVVCWWEILHSRGTGQAQTIQNANDAPRIAVVVASFAILHVLVNVAALFLDRGRSVPMRIINALSIGLSLMGLAACSVLYVRFTNPQVLGL